MGDDEMMDAKTSTEMLDSLLKGIPLRGNYVHITIDKRLLNRLANVNKEFGEAYDQKVGIK